jgi:hypothetical protein
MSLMGGRGGLTPAVFFQPPPPAEVAASGNSRQRELAVGVSLAPTAGFRRRLFSSPGQRIGGYFLHFDSTPGGVLYHPPERCNILSGKWLCLPTRGRPKVARHLAMRRNSGNPRIPLDTIFFPQ